MTSDPRKRVELDARRLGGLALRHQKLRVHKNGAKFTINKTYLDDGILSDAIPYTMILIPEDPPVPTDPFFHVDKFVELEYSIGGKTTVSMTFPYFVLDASCIITEHAIPLAGIGTLLHDLPRGIEPLEISPGVGSLVLSFFEFTRLKHDPTGVLQFKPPENPYNMLSIGARVRHAGTSGAWVTDMLLTDELVMRGGRGLNGYNTSMADAITFSWEGPRASCDVLAGGQHVMSVSTFVPPVHVQEMTRFAFSAPSGNVQLWTERFKGDFGQVIGGGGAGIVLGDHDLAKRLASAGITANPMSTLVGRNIQGVEGPPLILGAANE